MRFLHLCFGGLLVTAACAGSSGGPLDDGGASNDAASGNDGTTASDAPNNPDVTPTDATTKPDTGGNCPDESGGYSIQLVGAGCGDTSSSVNECIQQTACAIKIDFGGGSGKGVKGDAQLQSDGSFTNAAMEEGSSQRTGCVGKWDAQASTLVITCGGTNTTQSCVATLVRTSNVCQ